MYLENVVEGLLRGLDQQVSSLGYSLVDSVLRIVLILILVPRQGIQGFLYVMILSNILTSLLNLHRLLKVTGLRLQWGKWILRPVLAMATSGLSVWFFTAASVEQPLSLVLPAGGHSLAALGYGFLLLLLGCVTREDARVIRRA